MKLVIIGFWVILVGMQLSSWPFETNSITPVTGLWICWILGTSLVGAGLHQIEEKERKEKKNDTYK